MKRYILSLLALVATMSINAQVVRVYENGTLKETYINTTDKKYKAAFEEYIPVTSVSLNKTTTSINWGANETLTATISPANVTCSDVTWSSSNTSVATVDESGKVSIPSTAKDGATATITVTSVYDNKSASCTVTVVDNNLLPSEYGAGAFSVSATKKVRFTKGNLQATYSTSTSSYTWGFADNQYDYVGNKAGNTSISSQTDGAVVDLFGWSTSNTNYGINTSTNNGTYSGDFKDWGTNFPDRAYSTLSSAEWAYLLNISNATSGARTYTNRFAYARVNNVPGLLIFPDDFNGTVAYEGVQGVAQVNTITTYPTSSIPDYIWTSMESFGVVFLPAAQYRATQVNTENYGDYWSSTAASSTYAYYIDFNNNYFPAPNVRNSNRATGRSVRLVSVASE